MFSQNKNTTNGLEELNQLRKNCGAANYAVRDCVLALYKENPKSMIDVVDRLNEALKQHHVKFTERTGGDTLKKIKTAFDDLVVLMKDSDEEGKETIQKKKSGSLEHAEFFEILKTSDSDIPKQILDLFNAELEIEATSDDYLLDIRLHAEILMTLADYAISIEENDKAKFKATVDIMFNLDKIHYRQMLRENKLSSSDINLQKKLAEIVDDNLSINIIVESLHRHKLLGVDEKTFEATLNLINDLNRSKDEINKSSNADINKLAIYLELLRRITAQTIEKNIVGNFNKLCASDYQYLAAALQYLIKLIDDKSNELIDVMFNRIERLADEDLPLLFTMDNTHEFINDSRYSKYVPLKVQTMVNDAANEKGFKFDTITAGGVKKYMLYIAKNGSKAQKARLKMIFSQQINLDAIADVAVKQVFQDLIKNQVIDTENSDDRIYANKLIGYLQHAEIVAPLNEAILLAFELDRSSKYSLKSYDGFKDFVLFCERAHVNEPVNADIFIGFIKEFKFYHDSLKTADIGQDALNSKLELTKSQLHTLHCELAFKESELKQKSESIRALLMTIESDASPELRKVKGMQAERDQLMKDFDAFKVMAKKKSAELSLQIQQGKKDNACLEKEKNIILSRVNVLQSEYLNIINHEDKIAPELFSCFLEKVQGNDAGSIASLRAAFKNLKRGQHALVRVIFEKYKAEITSSAKFLNDIMPIITHYANNRNLLDYLMNESDYLMDFIVNATYTPMQAYLIGNCQANAYRQLWDNHSETIRSFKNNDVSHIISILKKSNDGDVQTTQEMILSIDQLIKEFDKINRLANEQNNDAIYTALLNMVLIIANIRAKALQGDITEELLALLGKHLQQRGDIACSLATIICKNTNNNNKKSFTQLIESIAPLLKHIDSDKSGKIKRCVTKCLECLNSPNDKAKMQEAVSALGSVSSKLSFKRAFMKFKHLLWKVAAALTPFEVAKNHVSNYKAGITLFDNSIDSLKTMNTELKASLRNRNA